MANNKSIQFFRGNSTQRKASSEVLLAGQPFYETDTNLLYMGNGSTQIKATTPVGHTIQVYWENVGKSGAINVKLGDRAFIETIDGKILPALCVDSSFDNGTTWQVSWPEKHRLAPDSPTVTTWGGTELCTWLNSTVLNLLPDYLKNIITSVTKSSGGNDAGISCNLWVPSAEEIYGYNNSTFPADMAKDSNARQFGYYKQLLGESEVSAVDYNYKLQGNSSYWLRNKMISSVYYWYVAYFAGALFTGRIKDRSQVVFCFTIK